jgi:hypothetical protein
MPVDIEEVLASLSNPKIPLAEAADHVPKQPGLYAIYGSAAVWRALGLGEPPDGRPLYVGKAEDSLVTRDIKTHFGDGRTGQSTVRRSFAALLRSRLGLTGMPRNPEKPAYFSNYGLSPSDDAKLTKWMLANLKLGVWAPTDEERATVSLLEVERQVLARWKPPLNLKDVFTEWTDTVKAARKVMADQARAWKPESR